MAAGSRQRARAAGSGHPHPSYRDGPSRVVLYQRGSFPGKSLPRQAMATPCLLYHNSRNNRCPPSQRSIGTYCTAQSCTVELRTLVVELARRDGQSFAAALPRIGKGRAGPSSLLLPLPFVFVVPKKNPQHDELQNKGRQAGHFPPASLAPWRPPSSSPLTLSVLLFPFFFLRSLWALRVLPHLPPQPAASSSRPTLLWLWHFPPSSGGLLGPIKFLPVGDKDTDKGGEGGRQDVP
ncbi:hypothetical protein EDC01DRAFT_462758 [Geopyxis carbonaria]|nr:hypothetical protein EDC01DRAFT_462758 [Geopyxis carbonaria]